jgi:hypothetical protein
MQTLKKVMLTMIAVIVSIVSSASPSYADLPPGCSPSQLGTYFADVTGDGKADAIVVNTGPNGRVTVRPSNGSVFLPNEDWTDIPYFGNVGTNFADVTGDGKADAIAVNTGGITVRRATGHWFGPNETWTVDPFFGDLNLGTYFADVTGDNLADAIAVTSSGIKVRPSDGTRFLPPQLWTTTAYSGSRGTFFADVTADGIADAIAVNNNKITVRRPWGFNAGAFGSIESWTANAYYGNLGTYFADVTGDGVADAIVVNTMGPVTVRRSDTTTFLGNERWTQWPYYGNIGTYFADVTGDGKADAIVVNMNGVVVRPSNGNGTGFLPNEVWTEGPYYGDLYPLCIN